MAAIALVTLALLFGACSESGDTVRYRDRGGRQVIVDCSGDDPQIRFADTKRPTMDFYQDARKACARLKN